MTTQQDRATVREHWPHAHPANHEKGACIRAWFARTPTGAAVLGIGHDTDSAWADAARIIRGNERKAAK